MSLGEDKNIIFLVKVYWRKGLLAQLYVGHTDDKT